MKKRVLSAALAVCMALALLPAAGLVPSAAAANAATVIQLGDYVQMGTYNGKPILWRCAAFERATGSNNTIDSTDTKTAYEDGYLPLMLSDTMLCQKEFDAPGKVKTGSHGWDLDNRKYYGSNYWGDSNIRSWLNSSSSTVSWPCGNPPSSYKSEKGFLTNFSALEKGAMKTVRQRSIVTNHDKASLSGGSEYYAPDRSTYTFDQALGNYNKAYYVWTSETMFLLDVQQACNAYQSGNIPDTGSEKAWLRTPPYNTGGYAMCIAAGKVNYSDTSYNTVGVYPAFFLDPSAELAGSGTKDDPYTVVEPTPSHRHCVCGREDGGGDHGEALAFQSLPSIIDLRRCHVLPEGNYYLTSNITFKSMGNATGVGYFLIRAGTTVTLCLNGHTVAGAGPIGSPSAYYSFRVESGGTLILCDCSEHETGKISQPSGRTGPGIYVSGTLELYSGSITGTSTGVNLHSGSSFTMHGGSITGNSASGVKINSDGAFTMTGGTISNNTAKSGGGGVNGAEGAVTLSGDAQITGNKVGSTVNNLYLGSDKTITIGEGGLTDGASIGVTTYATPTVGSPVTISGTSNGDYHEYFTSDNAKYTVKYNLGAKRLVLSAPTPPHSHDMSSTCGSAAPIDFDHALTSQDGKLCVDGVAVPSAELPGGNYYLAGNVSLTDGLTVTGAVNLCLGGMTLDLGNGALETAAVGSLSLCDCGSTGAITSRNADGTILASGPVTLYGGEIGSAGGSAVCLDGGSLALSGDAKLSGAGDKADIGLRNETREQHITLAAPLTNTVPYRVSSEGARPFTSGWTAHMGDADFSRYFKSVTVGRFIEKNAGGELTLVDCAITEQPTAANGYTVTANGAPSSYQWYSGGTAVSGQTSNALTDTAPGSYFCRVTWPDGATVDSDAVTIAPPSHSHVWASEWTTNATHHWHECTAEGCGVTENSGKNGYATHREDSGTVTKQPTETETGLKTFSCTVCGYVTRTETLPKVEPTPTPTFGGGSDSLYTLTASAGEGGTVTPSGKINVRQGQWKTFVITPGEGYVVADVLVDDESVGAVKDYTFENVSRRHSIEAKFQKIENQSGWNPFVDVKAGDGCYESVKYVYEKGWMEGTSSTTFEPSGTLTRAMLATALYRAAGSPAVTGALEFPDAKTGIWYSDAILWASQIKLLRGYEDGSFRPDIPVSREMMNMVIGRQNGEDPAWTGDPALAVPAARAEVAETLMRYDKK